MSPGHRSIICKQLRVSPDTALTSSGPPAALDWSPAHASVSQCLLNVVPTAELGTPPLASATREADAASLSLGASFFSFAS